jgi:hypothetical protein
VMVLLTVVTPVPIPMPPICFGPRLSCCLA